MVLTAQAAALKTRLSPRQQGEQLRGRPYPESAAIPADLRRLHEVL